MGGAGAPTAPSGYAYVPVDHLYIKLEIYMS